MKVGIPRAIYYYLEPIWIHFFEYLQIEVITSPKTDNKVLQMGINISNDEACLALKIYMGHVACLTKKCDYIFVPVIDNFGLHDQTCSNHIVLYDLVKNNFKTNILTCHINLKNNNELKAFYEIGKQLNIDKKTIKKAYQYANVKNKKQIKKNHINSCNRLKSDKTKILIVSHPYNSKDEFIGAPIVNKLKQFGCEIIYSDEFDSKITNKLANKLSNDLYWKYSKDSIGSIVYCQDKIDGIVFLTAFPCGLDSLVNELVIRKIELPYLNLIIDSIASDTGIDTRIESFIDIVKGGNYV